MSRVTVDVRAVERIADRRGAAGAAATAEFMAAQQRSATRSSRLRDAVSTSHGRDQQGWYARAGMLGVTSRHPAWFWYFEEYRTGRGGGTPFLRQALWGNTGTIRRMMTGGGL